MQFFDTPIPARTPLLAANVRAPPRLASEATWRTFDQKNIPPLLDLYSFLRGLEARSCSSVFFMPPLIL